MKIIKYVFSICLVAIAIYGCSQDDENNDFEDSIVAPRNVSANVVVTQDNTGLVTITPFGEGVTNFTVGFGDQTEEANDIQPGNGVDHTYAEGTYEATITAHGLNGLSTSIVQTIVVSFQAPENLVVTISNDSAVSKQVNVEATADFALSYEINFGDPADTVIMTNDEMTSFIYDSAGTYTITVTAFSAAVDTAIYSEVFEVTEILQPLTSAPQPPFRQESDVISLFSNAYELDVNVSTWATSWSSSTLTDLQIGGDDTKFYSDTDFVGVEFLGADAVNASQMEAFHFDFWSANSTTFRVKLVDLEDATEAEIVFEDLPQNEWVSIDIPMSDFTDAGMTSINSIQQLIFSGIPVGTFDFFVDNVYFWKASSSPSTLVGTWKIAPEDGALSVGPGDGSLWWFLNQFGDDVTTRSCFMDDRYVFNSDGSFQNVLGSQTWLEPWQGVDPEACGFPIAPHDGTNPATYTNDGSTITLNGSGAYLGLAKVHNAGEDGMAAGDTITYDYTLSNSGNTLEITLSGFNGGAEVWYYKLIREGAVASPIVGTWQVAPEDGAISVGPGDGSLWWYLNLDGDDVTTRACYIDDQYIFNADGSFQNVLGSETWLEQWQGVDPPACGAPIAPHDGSNPATWSSNSSTITINGSGAFIGLAKVHNTGEDGMATGDTITYDYTLSGDGNTLEVTISGFAGGAEVWYYKLIKQ